MPKKLKCRSCELTNEFAENMECEATTYESGKTIRIYFHKGECWDKYLKHKEFIAIDNQQRDSLTIVLKELHKTDYIPDTFFSSYLQPLRNGNFKQGKKVLKYKNGFTFAEIEDAYKYCRNDISWARKNKEFDGVMAELKYCIAIIVDKIHLSKKNKKKEEMAKFIADQKGEASKASDFNDQKEVKFKKKEVKDFSEFLD